MNFASFSEELVRYPSRRSGGLIVIEQVDSTHLLGRRIVDEYARESAVAPATDILAWCQATGQGRQGRSWSSPPGCGAYVTMLREGGPQNRLQVLPLHAAVVICERLNLYLEGACRLKWPNDLLVGDKKLGGILIDAVTHGEEALVLAMSFGINHSLDLAAVGESRATSLLREMTPTGGSVPEAAPSLAQLALDLIENLDREFVDEVSPAEVIERYVALSQHRPGDFLSCRLGGGDEVVEGAFVGFDEHGFLRLEVEGEERLLSSAEILPMAEKSDG